MSLFRLDLINSLLAICLYWQSVCKSSTALMSFGAPLVTSVDSSNYHNRLNDSAKPSEVDTVTQLSLEIPQTTVAEFSPAASLNKKKLYPRP